MKPTIPPEPPAPTNNKQAPTAHLITGATGFVGGALVLELLQRTDHTIVCLVRPGEQDPQQRLWQALDTAAAAYDTPTSVTADIRQRVIAVAGDVEQPLCGVNLAHLPQLHYRTFWHSAASLRFEDRHAEQIFRSNVDGTRHALALANALNMFDFNSMSTAYVAGAATGTQPEARINSEVGAKPNNLYEKSKIEAEELVLAATQFALRIFRPSIVIGHSRTYGATNFTGLYGLLRQMFTFQQIMARTEEDLLQKEALRLRVDVGIPVDLVPIDRVVANAVTIWLATQADIRPGQAQFYHLNNPTPPTIDSTINIIWRMVGLLPPTYLTSDAQRHEMQWLDEQLNTRIEFYASYFRNHKVFDRQNTASLVGEEDPSLYTITPQVLEAYCQPYLQQLIAERANMPVSR